jgi:hypothetical protein
VSDEIFENSDSSLPENEEVAPSSDSSREQNLQDIAPTLQRLEKLLLKVEGENKVLLRFFCESVFGKKTVDVGNPLLDCGEQVWREELNRLANGRLQDSSFQKQARHLVIPIHLPKVFHISSIFSSLSNERFDTEEVRVTLVATGKYEKAVIERYLAVTRAPMPRYCEVISALEVTEAAGWTRLGEALSQNQRGGGRINMKKLLSVSRAFALGAEEVCCIDADTLLLKPVGSLFDQVEKNYARKVFFAAGSPIDITKSTYRAAANFFSPNDEKILDEIYGVDRFSWFFDIPFYKREDFFQFLQHVAFLYGGVEEAWATLTWNHFDHILYVNYLLLRGDFKLLDLVPIVGDGKITDDLDLNDLDRIRDIHRYQPAWLTLTAATQGNIEGKDCISRGFSAIFHVDRVASLSDA